ncbi:MAG: GDP-mannose 4,6-dehydratase [Gammaproteobacteria bacterium]
MSPPYLVTGAAGFIGSHSVDQLLAAGRRVIGVDNLRSGHLANLAAAFTSPGFEFIEADAGDETTMRSLFQRSRPGGVLHLAALVSVPESFKDPAYNYHANLAAGDLLARLCVEYGGVRIVFASSAAVYGDTSDLPCRESSPTRPLSPYAAAKLAAEVMLLGYAASYGYRLFVYAISMFTARGKIRARPILGCCRSSPSAFEPACRSPYMATANRPATSFPSRCRRDQYPRATHRWHSQRPLQCLYRCGDLAQSGYRTVPLTLSRGAARAIRCRAPRRHSPFLRRPYAIMQCFRAGRPSVFCARAR